MLLTDYRSGTLGRISLETPDTRAAMIAATKAAASTGEVDTANEDPEID